MRGLHDLVEGIARDQASHFVKKLSDRNLLSRELLDPLILAENAQGRSDSGNEEIRTTDALGPEEVKTLLGDWPDLGNLSKKPGWTASAQTSRMLCLFGHPLHGKF